MTITLISDYYKKLTRLSLYLQLKSIDNLFIKSILHTDGFDKADEPLMNYKYGTVCQF